MKWKANGLRLWYSNHHKTHTMSTKSIICLIGTNGLKIRRILQLMILICLISGIQGSEERIDHSAHFHSLSHKSETDFCTQQALQNENPKERKCDKLNIHHLKYFLSIFGMIAWGSAIRTFLRTYRIKVPYTVVLMISGIVFGFGSRVSDDTCETWSTYTIIARTPPKIILYVFLPVLIFESAFSMKGHVFLRSLFQILIAALPGMVISTVFIGLFCRRFFYYYDWSLNTSLLFAAIISATDPVAVVAILGDIGASEILSVLVEGESLLNDGVAILFYDVLKEAVETEFNPYQIKGKPMLYVMLQFLQISLGGPIVGFVIGKLSVAFLARIYNDAAAEIAITLVSAYLTYFIGEYYLGVSGVLAVVVLGVTLGTERTVISPEVYDHVREFWEMLAFFANTVLFVMVGVIISETAITSFELRDLYYLSMLYFVVMIVRFLMICVLSPFMARLGYGIDWASILVMSWGGLRGAVGMCLALEIYQDRGLCHEVSIGPKYLILTAGIVVLTLLINGTFTKAILDLLKLSDTSKMKVDDMNHTIKQIHLARSRAVSAMKHDPFLADSNWDQVMRYTEIKNHYLTLSGRATTTTTTTAVPDDTTVTTARNPSRIISDKWAKVGSKETTGGPEWIPTEEEYQSMLNDTRMRLLQAIHISLWRQYEEGLLSDESLQILETELQEVEDRQFAFLQVGEMRRHWHVHGFAPWLRNKLYEAKFRKKYHVPPPPKGRWRSPFYWFATRSWFDIIISVIVCLNVVPIGMETYYLFSDNLSSTEERVFFFYSSVVFTALYLMEFIILVVGLGWKYYLSDKFHWLDFVVLIASLMELVITSYLYAISTSELERLTGDQPYAHLNYLKNARLIRFFRAFRLIRFSLPIFRRAVDHKINHQLFLGYDVGKGFITAIDDTLKLIHNIEGPKVLDDKLKDVLHTCRLETVYEMGLLQCAHPGVAVAVMTRHSSRTILNKMKDKLMQIKEEGLLDKKEFELLSENIEESTKRLWNSPASIEPSSPASILANVSWILNNAEILDFINNNAILLNFKQGNPMSRSGDKPDGIYIIISGLVKVSYVPNVKDVQNLELYGQIPNSEIFAKNITSPVEDYLMTGMTLGRLGVLTGAKKMSSVVCETNVLAYHLKMEDMMAALDTFRRPQDTLESRLWRSWGIRLASVYLTSQYAFANWSTEHVRSYLEGSIVPIGDSFRVLNVPTFIKDVILIYGQATERSTNEVYTAPCVIPKYVKTLEPKDPTKLPKYLLVPEDSFLEDVKRWNPGQSSNSSHDELLKALNVQLLNVESVQSLASPIVIPQRRQSLFPKKRASLYSLR